MLDYNHSPSFTERLNATIDGALTDENATRVPRDYLGGSRLGHACERALQFEFTATPRDEGQDFSGQTLRIFAIGHALEDLGPGSQGRGSEPLPSHVKPRGHEVHLALPCSSLNFPREHASAHGVVRPVSLLYFPGSHKVHSESDAIPVFVENLPAAHHNP